MSSTKGNEGLSGFLIDVLADSAPTSAPAPHIASTAAQAGPGGRFACWASCTCGWRSEAFASHDKALEVAALHERGER